MRAAGPGASWYTQVWDRYALDGFLKWTNSYFTGERWEEPQTNAPLLLKLSFNRPHYPYVCDEEKFRYYLNRVMPHVEHPRTDHPYFTADHAFAPGTDLSAHEIRRATATYYGMIEECDADFRLAAEGLTRYGEDLDDWIVVFKADHRDLLGQHGLWTKHQFFEGSVGVPLVIRWPRELEPRIVDENVNLRDLFATLCDLCSVPVPDGLDSRSLVPLMRGHADDWDDETISHFHPEYLMIKRGSLKYHYYGEQMPAFLVDLDSDPAELHDLSTDPTYRDVMAGFRKRRDSLGYGPHADPEYIRAGY